MKEKRFFGNVVNRKGTRGKQSLRRTSWKEIIKGKKVGEAGRPMILIK